jgi:hypothetical protein
MQRVAMAFQRTQIQSPLSICFKMQVLVVTGLAGQLEHRQQIAPQFAHLTMLPKVQNNGAK